VPTVTFFPLGNADCCRIDLTDGQKVLFDYADTRCKTDPKDKRADLPKLLRDDLRSAGRDYYDAGAFTHLDNDHCCGSSEFFELRHAKKYQGAGRIKINTMWVPAAAICEDRADLSDDGKAIQAEARYRLVQGNGIRVFSRPAALEAWLKTQGLTLESRKNLITDAGQLAPEFNLTAHGVEFFVHSPFASRHDDGTFTDRNSCSLVMQAVFVVGGRQTKLILSADTIHEVWTEIVRITKFHGRPERLEWDIFKLPHHCSFLSIGPEKGEDKTAPVEAVKWIFEEQGQLGWTVVSTSDPIPTTANEDQPPHRQAANYYKGIRNNASGKFEVTMEHPSTENPEPLVISIDARKATIRRRPAPAAASILGGVAPRAGTVL
jgi:hypothetical protein